MFWFFVVVVVIFVVIYCIFIVLFGWIMLVFCLVDLYTPLEWDCLE